MRLICPNCSAQYEIDASLIPDEGRDVQCSNCGHNWFELPPPPLSYSETAEPYEPDGEAEVEGEVRDLDTSPDLASDAFEAAEEPVDQPEPESEPEVEPEFEDEFVEPIAGDDAAEPESPPEPADTSDLEDTPEPEVGEDDDDRELSDAVRAIAAASREPVEDEPQGAPDPFAAAAVAGTAFKRREVDAATLEILKDEAERELAQRRAAPTTPIETQTDMGLDEVRGRNTPTRALRARMAREKTEDAPRKKGAQPKQDPRVHSSDDSYEAPRRDLLPDIDEINSSLKPRRGAKTAAPDAEIARRRGFRSGFLLMVGLAVLMIFAYAWAPDIARMVPSLEGPLLTYVDLANTVRDWLDAMLSGS